MKDENSPRDDRVHRKVGSMCVHTVLPHRRDLNRHGLWWPRSGRVGRECEGQPLVRSSCMALSTGDPFKCSRHTREGTDVLVTALR